MRTEKKGKPTLFKRFEEIKGVKKYQKLENE
jgi:hypothetical protein